MNYRSDNVWGAFPTDAMGPSLSVYRLTASLMAALMAC